MEPEEKRPTTAEEIRAKSRKVVEVGEDTYLIRRLTIRDFLGLGLVPEPGQGEKPEAYGARISEFLSKQQEGIWVTVLKKAMLSPRLEDCDPLLVSPDAVHPSDIFGAIPALIVEVMNFSEFSGELTNFFRTFGIAGTPAVDTDAGHDSAEIREVTN